MNIEINDIVFYKNAGNKVARGRVVEIRHGILYAVANLTYRYVMIMERNDILKVITDNPHQPYETLKCSTGALISCGTP